MARRIIEAGGESVLRGQPVADAQDSHAAHVSQLACHRVDRLEAPHPPAAAMHVDVELASVARAVETARDARDAEGTDGVERAMVVDQALVGNDPVVAGTPQLVQGCRGVRGC